MSECILGQIANRELRAKVLYSDDLVLALDLPKDHPVRIAPVHFLVVPKSTFRLHEKPKRDTSPPSVGWSR